MEPELQTPVTEEITGDVSFDGGDIETPSTPVAPTESVTQTQTPVAAPATTPANDFVSIRDAARVYGVDLSTFQDDRSALAHLLQQAQAARQDSFYANLGRQVAPHYDTVRKALQQQQAPQQQAQEQSKPWQRPEWDDTWLTMVERDANGNFVAKPGFNPAIADKVQAAHNWMQKFARDPMSVIEPYVQDVIQTRVAEAINNTFESRVSQLREQSEIQRVMEQHSDWLYLRDDAGNPIRDPYTGKYQPSPAGAYYVKLLQQASQLGIRGAANQNAYAIQLLQAEVVRQQALQGTTPQAGPGSTARPNVNPANTLTEPTRRNVVPGTSEQPNGQKTLQQLMREAFEAEGIQDSDLAIAS